MYRHHPEIVQEEVRKEIRVEVNADDSGQMEAVIKTVTTENGETITEEKIITGTEEEVKAAVEEMKEIDIQIKRKNKHFQLKGKSRPIWSAFFMC